LIPRVETSQTPNLRRMQLIKKGKMKLRNEPSYLI
jgi:hypothetical protein